MMALALAAFVGLAFALGGSGAADPGPNKPPENPVTYAQIAKMSKQVQTVTGSWPGLTEFLQAVAYWESSHRDGSPPNASACHGDCLGNSARGLYQIRPKTVDVYDVPSVLFDPREATALAVGLIFHLAKYRTHENQIATWLDIRRGWRKPALVKDWAEEDPESVMVRERFVKSLSALGYAPELFMDQDAIPPGVHDPGHDAIASALGVYGS